MNSGGIKIKDQAVEDGEVIQISHWLDCGYAPVPLMADHQEHWEERDDKGKKIKKSKNVRRQKRTKGSHGQSMFQRGAAYNVNDIDYVMLNNDGAVIEKV